MKNIIILTILLLSFGTFLSCSEQEKETYNNGNVYRTVIYPAPGELYSLAEYRIWIPEGISEVKGIIVHQHGCGRNGMSMPYDVHWQALAKKWNYALLGTHYVATDSCATWYNPHNGSDRAFADGIRALSAESGHPELNEVPWAIWGHSGGGRWVINMLRLHPERIVGVFARSGGGSPTPEGLKVPVVFNYGINDMRPEMYFRTYKRFRDAGGYATQALDSTTGHNTGNSRLIAIPFFDDCIAAHENAGSASSPSYSGYWLGDPSTGEIFEGKTFEGNQNEMTWLITGSFAKKWQEFVRTGDVTDQTAPEKAPYELSAAQNGNTVTIHFKIDADLESGVKDVFLYRDGQEIQRYIGPNDSYNEKHFQYANYGDEPVPEALYENVDEWIPTLLEFTDYRLEQGKNYQYTIMFTNWSDLKSPMSEPLNVTIQ